MKSISGKALCKIIERYGWQLKRISSSHHTYTKQGMRSSYPFQFMVTNIYQLVLLKVF